MVVSIFPNPKNAGAMDIADETDRILSKLGVRTNIVQYADNGFLDVKENISKCDIAISIGGDGTTLNIAKLASFEDKATLGINAGRVGFMSGLERDELDLLKNLVSGKYDVESRMMIRADVLSHNEIVGTYHCLNDAVVSRGDLARLIDIKVSCDGRLVTSNRADGMIVSTPTGSTAYSMAAGGPVLSPDNSCFVVTPICPHSLVNRSIVFPSKNIITLSVGNDKNNSAFLSIDGEESIRINSDTSITIRRSQYVAKLIKLKPDNFYEILNKKLIERRY